MPENVLTSESETAVPPTLEPPAASDAPADDATPPEEPAATESESLSAPVDEPVVVDEAEAELEPTAPPEPPSLEAMAPATSHDEEPPDEPPEAPAAAEGEPEPEPSNKRWYVVKVQSGREETIKEAIERRVKIERLEENFGQIIIPVERVTEMRKGKRVVKEKKLFPGYLMAEVEYNDHILYLFRETSGVGDFVGGTLNRPPPPMSPREVDTMLGRRPGQEAKEPNAPVKPPVDRGDRVRVRDGTFAGMEGEVKEILETLNHVRVELTIFGRPVPVELEYWQVEVV
jgi:transcription termination/antitermination protein NusG